MIETTGCKIPCRYNEYKVVGEPQSGSTGKMGASEKWVPDIHNKTKYFRLRRYDEV